MERFKWNEKSVDKRVHEFYGGSCGMTSRMLLELSKSGGVQAHLVQRAVVEVLLELMAELEKQARD